MIRAYRNLKTRTKLVSAFLIMALLMGAIGIIGIVNMGTLYDSAKSMYTDVALSTNKLQEAEVNYTRLRVQIRDLNTADTAAEVEEVMVRIEDAKTKLRDGIESYRNGYMSQGEIDAFAPFDDAWKAYEETFNRGIELAMNEHTDELNALIREELQPRGDVLSAVINDTVSAAVRFGDDSDANNQTLYQQSMWVMITILAIGLGFSIVMGIAISQMISRPLNRVVAVVSKVSEGDLTESLDIDTKDETGQLAGSVNKMVEKLRETIGEILLSAQSVSAASEQISASTEEIASGSSNQANAAQTINELFKELTAGIQSIAENTEQASELSGRTIEVAKAGNEVVQTSMSSMKAVSEQMSKLESDSQKIGDIIQVIEDIADQTNLLALNAAIEAARAGEQGRGFAVVADEVRKLAERSGEATKQITSIIKGMQDNTRHSVDAVQQSVSLSNRTGESFNEITTIVQETGMKVTEIAAASEEQSAQAATVLESVESISAVTEEAAASSQETASTAQSLAQLAEDLQQAVSKFRIK